MSNEVLLNDLFLVKCTLKRGSKPDTKENEDELLNEIFLTLALVFCLKLNFWIFFYV